MKIIYIILTITFTLVSCSENDENLSEPQEVSLIGQWELIETPPETFKETYNFEGANLILNPDYLNCIEDCFYKFQKK